MIERVLNRYTYIFVILMFLHVITVTVDGFLNSFDYTFIIFILTMEMADEDSYIWMAVLLGFFTDFIRDGLYGPGVALFALFYLVRFRSDVIMDMTKLHYRVLLFSSMSYVFCFTNFMVTDYTLNSALYLAMVRTVVNIVIIFIIFSFFKGLNRAVKNS